MLGNDRRIDAAADVEIGRDTHESGRQECAQIAEDLVRNRLMKRSYVPERPDIAFQRFELDAEGARDVLDQQRREIRLARSRAQAGEFRIANPDHVIVLRVWVRKRLEPLRARLSCGCGGY
jgi:hypothetical protein